MYVGISQHVLERLREHALGSDHYSATLAYRIAATKRPHGRTAAKAMQDPVFRGHFDAERGYLKGLAVAFIRIDNPLEAHLFEAYCAMELDTGLDSGGSNSFATH